MPQFGTVAPTQNNTKLGTVEDGQEVRVYEGRVGVGAPVANCGTGVNHFTFD